MKMLVIGDVHLKPYIFDKADKILRAGLADRAIQMGDLVDDWGEEFNLSLYSKTMQRAVQFHKNHPKTLWVTGNHDYGYSHPYYGPRESGHSKLAEGEVQTWLGEMRRVGAGQKILRIVDKCIFTHAGLTKEWMDNQIRNVDAGMDKLSDSYAETIANFADPDDIWLETSPIWVRPQIDKYEMWSDKLQVVGHTPVKTPTLEDGVLSTDTFSTYSNGAPFGDKSFVVVDTETGEWTKITEEEYDAIE